MKWLKQLAVSLALSGLAASAHATPMTLDFEGATLVNGWTVEQDGFRFQTASGSGISLHNHSSYNGTSGLSVHPYAGLTLSRVDNGSFALVELTQWYGQVGTTITATTSAGDIFDFFMTDNSQVTPGELVSFDQTYFSNVTSVQFGWTPQYTWGIDDVVVDDASPVPEPLGLSLLGLGLAGLGFGRKAKRRA